VPRGKNGTEEIAVVLAANFFAWQRELPHGAGETQAVICHFIRDNGKGKSCFAICW